jgi:hypothetical protein
MMNEFPPPVMGAQPRMVRADDTDSIDSVRGQIYSANDNPSQVVYYAPKERFRLGYFDVMCLVINRTIGKISH